MKKIIMSVIVLVLVALASFYGGLKYSDIKKSSVVGMGRDFRNLPPEERAQRFAQMENGTRRIGSRQAGHASNDMVIGEVISKDDNSVTVKLRDGGSRIVFFSPSTTIMKATSVTGDNLEVGGNVMVNGSANQDGSISAQIIQIRAASQG